MRLRLQFKGFVDTVDKLRKLNGDVKKTTEKALEKTFDIVTKKAETAITPHNKTHATEKSLRRTSNVEWWGDVASISAGFDISNGGLPSIFLARGVPRHTTPYGIAWTERDPAFDEAFWGKETQKYIRKVQADIFAEAIRKAK